MNNSALARGAPLALPVGVVDRVVDELLAHGHVRRAYIGVAVHPVALSASVVARHDLASDRAVVVMSVADGSPAAAAGILVGDVLIAAGGASIRGPSDLLDAMATIGRDASLEISHLRGGDVKLVTVIPVDRETAGTRE